MYTLYIYIYIYIYYIYIYYIYILYGDHKTLISHHGCSWLLILLDNHGVKVTNHSFNKLYMNII